LAYLNLLHKEIEKLKTGFGEIISQKPVNKCKKKTDTAVPGKISELDFNLFIQKKWDTVNAIITTGNFGDKEIHAIRKHLKDLFYNLKIYETAERKILSPGIWNRKDEACFYQLLEELGTFQDNCTAITLVNTYLKKRKKVNDREQVTQIKKIWIKNKRNRKQVLVNKLRSARTF